MVHQNSDLISQLGNTSKEGDSKPQPSGEVEPAKNVEPAPAATEAATSEGEPKATTGEEPQNKGVKDPDSWSKDTALKEVVKLREENKAQRHKYNEQLEKMKADLDAKYAPLQEQLGEMEKYKVELEKKKAEEEDKKRDDAEKIAHREARIAELQAEMRAATEAKEQELQNLKEQVSAFRAQDEARTQVYQERLDQEIDSIPDKFKAHAKLIAKGAGDPLEALAAINEARLQGLFEEKKVVVNHSVPSASDGARANKDQLEHAARAERDKMSSDQKISQALKDIRSGNPNSAFRSN